MSFLFAQDVGHARGDHASRSGVNVSGLSSLAGFQLTTYGRFWVTVEDRDFTATGPNQRWVADITYLRSPNGFIYLAVVLDLFSRAVVGWAVSAVIDRHLVIAALEMALKRRCPGPGLLCHSDQGSQYASDDYQKKLDVNGITCSMSRRGDCYDNAAMESWFGTLKTELGESFESMFEVKRQLFDYIEVFYNRKRMHSSLGYLSPAEFEQKAAVRQSAA